MKNIELAGKILIDILDKNISFTTALKNNFNDIKDKSIDKGLITQLIGCELRHHFIFKELVDRSFGELSNKSAVGLLLACANIRFLKRMDNDKLIEYAQRTLDENGVAYEKESFTLFFTHIKNDENLIPNDVESLSVEFLSFRHNVPIFLVKMWQKHVGRSMTFKILKSISKPGLKTYAVNTLKTTCDDFIKKNDELFEKTKFDNIVLYKGKSSIQKIDAINNFTLYPISMAERYMLDKLELNKFSKIAIYSNYTNTLYVDFCVKNGNEFKCDLITPSGKDYYNMTRNFHKIGLKDIRFYNCPLSSVITCISNPVDVFFVLPNNSRFSLLRSTPDYAIHFKQSKLDELIKEQSEALEECSKFVENDGLIVYAIPTFSNKEGHSVVAKFLEKNQNFSLIDEKQFLPLDEYDSLFYYAFIKKVGK